jgi:plastocyanin
MHFSRSIFAAALVGLGAATTHGEAAMVTSAAGYSAAMAEGMASTATALMAAVSESISTAAPMVESTATALEAQMPASTGTVATEGEILTHLVTVGDGGLTFSPANVVASPGDLVQFQFYPKVRLLPSYCCILEDKLT